MPNSPYRLTRRECSRCKLPRNTASSFTVESPDVCAVCLRDDARLAKWAARAERKERLKVTPRKCSSCGEVKQPSLFYKAEGHKCADCHRAASRQWRENNRARASANGKRLRSRRGYVAPTGERHMRQLARWRANRAVERGQAPPRPDNCPKCNVHKSVAKIHIHHPHGYSNPLDFEYLCSKCHGAEHRLTIGSSARNRRGNVGFEGTTDLPNMRTEVRQHAS